MRSHHAFAALLAMGLAATSPPRALGAEPRISDEQIVPETRLVRDVVVRDVEVRDGTVSGTVVNNSDKVLRDVRLMIRYTWLWDNEFHPGTDDPSRTDYYTLQQEIPPGGRVAFTYRPESPPFEARGGHFETDVKVASVVQFPATAGGAAPGGAPAPTAGAGAPGAEGLRPER